MPPPSPYNREVPTAPRRIFSGTFSKTSVKEAWQKGFLILKWLYVVSLKSQTQRMWRFKIQRDCATTNTQRLSSLPREVGLFCKCMWAFLRRWDPSSKPHFLKRRACVLLMELFVPLSPKIQQHQHLPATSKCPLGAASEIEFILGDKKHGVVYVHMFRSFFFKQVRPFQELWKKLGPTSSSLCQDTLWAMILANQC